MEYKIIYVAFCIFVCTSELITLIVAFQIYSSNTHIIQALTRGRTEQYVSCRCFLKHLFACQFCSNFATLKQYETRQRNMPVKLKIINQLLHFFLSPTQLPQPNVIVNWRHNWNVGWQACVPKRDTLPIKCWCSRSRRITKVLSDYDI